MKLIPDGAVRTRKDCRLCGSTDLAEVLSFGETPPANAYLSSAELNDPELFAPLVVTACAACKLIQLRDVVDPTVLFSRYLYVSGTSPVFVKHFEDYARTVVQKFSLAPNTLVVDVGSNDGTLLSKFKNEGMNILGIDPAENIAAEATEKGIPTLAAFLSADTARDVAIKYGKASVVTANNVFAHTDDVKSFTEAVKELLGPDGVFIFEVQYLKDLVEQNLFDIIYHEHLCYYHLTPLIPFFDAVGLQLFDVERVATHGGSLRVYVGRQGGSHRVSAEVGRLMAAETALNLPDTYQKLGERIAAGKQKLHELLDTFRREGKRVVGYGAPAKATTFCYAYGIDGSTIEYIVDDSPLKQGLYMPGTHIPIKSPETLYLDKPDCCVILAWNFSDSIAKNHSRFKEGGGVFISPVPEPRILN